MTSVDLPVQPELTAADDDWHDHSRHWWETETNWWSFNIPDRNMGGWLYTQALAVQGICNGGAWLWDDSAVGALYERNQHGLPFPDRGDLRNITFPNGVSVEALKPLMRYRTSTTASAIKTIPSAICDWYCLTFSGMSKRLVLSELLFSSCRRSAFIGRGSVVVVQMQCKPLEMPTTE